MSRFCFSGRRALKETEKRCQADEKPVKNLKICYGGGSS